MKMRKRLLAANMTMLLLFTGILPAYGDAFGDGTDFTAVTAEQVSEEEPVLQQEETVFQQGEAVSQQEEPVLWQEEPEEADLVEFIPVEKCQEEGQVEDALQEVSQEEPPCLDILEEEPLEEVLEEDFSEEAFLQEDLLFADMEEGEPAEENKDTASGRISVNAAEVDLYVLDPDYTELTIPEEYPQSFQLEVTGTDSKPVYSCSKSAYASATVDENGLIRPKPMKILRVGPDGMTYESVCYNYMDTDIQITVDGVTIHVTVHIHDYAYAYANKILETFIDEKIRPDMTQYEKAEEIAKWVSGTFYYDGSYSSMSKMVIRGGGDCWATTETVNTLCKKLGICAVMRMAANDPGAGKGHRNTVAVLDGKTYIIDCGYVGLAPRYYSIREQRNLFKTEELSDGTLKLTVYDGADADVVFPEEIDGKKVTVLGTSLFKSSFVSVKSITIPDTVTTLENGVFHGCGHVKKCFIPASVTSIGKWVFPGNLDGNFQSIDVDPANPVYVSEDGILFSKDKKTLVSFPAGRGGAYTIPEGVETIKEAAFYDADLVTEVNFSSTVTSVEKEAFDGCGNLVKLTLNEGLKTIGEEAFGWTTKLDSLTIPESVEKIGKLGLWMSAYRIKFLGENTSLEEKALGSSKRIVLGGRRGSAVETFALQNGNYFLELNEEGAAVLQDDWFEMSSTGILIYDGQPHEQIVFLNENAPLLEEGVDYELTYRNNVDAGEAEALVTGKGFYEGSVRKTYLIGKRSLPKFPDQLYFSELKDPYRDSLTVYATGEPLCPKVVVEGCEEGTDYEVTYENNELPGVAAAVVTGKGNYQGEVRRSFWIYGELLGIDPIEDQVYAGYGVYPKPHVQAVGEPNYSTSYKNADQVGTATVTVKGQRFYIGTVEAQYRIVEADIEGEDITVQVGGDSAPYTAYYTGREHRPYVYLKRRMPDGRSRYMTEGTDYTVSYENNLEPGTATITVTGKGNYKGSRTLTFVIEKQNTAQPATVTTSPATITIQPATVTTRPATVTIKPATVQPGSSKAAIIWTDADEEDDRGAGLEKTDTGKPQKPVLKGARSKKAGQVTLSWKKVPDGQKYQVQISRNKKFRSGVRRLTIDGRKTSCTVKKLARRKNYYIRIRTVKKLGGKTYYSGWSAVKKVKTK